MKKIFPLFVCVFLLSLCIFSQEKNDYDKFLDEVDKGFSENAKKLNEEYKLGEYDRWDANQDTGKLTFSNKGVVKVVASFQIAGSYSLTSNSWMWSWANETIDVPMKRDLNKVKEFGEKNKFTELTTPKFWCLEESGWRMTAIAGHLIKAKGAYRGPIPNGFVYLLITDIKWAEK